MPTLGELLYSAVDGAYAVDEKQRIIYWDPGCEEMFDRSTQWVLGRPCYSVVCGKNPVTGAEFCNRNCPVARLGSGSVGPNNFTISTQGKDQQAMNVTVNIALVPSTCKKGWISMHLLHRGDNQNILESLELSQPGPVKRPYSTAASLGKCDLNVSRLSKRENEVLQLLAEGLALDLISKRLNISRTTVRNHIQHLQQKLGVHSQTAAVAYAYRHNLVH